MQPPTRWECYTILQKQNISPKRKDRSLQRGFLPYNPEVKSLSRDRVARRRIWIAAGLNNISMVQELLQRGISPNHQYEEGQTPLHISACRGYIEMVNILLEHGADPDKRDYKGNTPLHLAIINNKLNVVDRLLTASPDVFALDSYGCNPLQVAKAKLKILEQTYHNDASVIKMKGEMSSIINMLIGYLRKQSNTETQVETLTSFYSRLSLSNTSNQIQDDFKDLLTNIDNLNIS